jgi:hypothetical protein
MGNFFISIMEKESQKPTQIIGCPSSSGFEDDGHLLTFMYGIYVWVLLWRDMSMNTTVSEE